MKYSDRDSLIEKVRTAFSSAGINNEAFLDKHYLPWIPYWRINKMIGKKRPIAHIKGETGVQILKRHLPAEWVPREYVPDYGIDLSIELFSPAEGGYVTKGEHVFFQVKSTDSIDKGTYKINPRMNVEKEYRDLAAYGGLQRPLVRC